MSESRRGLGERATTALHQPYETASARAILLDIARRMTWPCYSPARRCSLARVFLVGMLGVSLLCFRRAWTYEAYQLAATIILVGCGFAEKHIYFCSLGNFRLGHEHNAWKEHHQ